MNRSQALRMVWLGTVRSVVSGGMPLIGCAVGYFAADEILDLDFETSIGVALVAGAVFFGVGLYVLRFVPKPGA